MLTHPSRTLRLQRESLSELTPGELGGVAGASGGLSDCVVCTDEIVLLHTIVYCANPLTSPQNCNTLVC